MLESNLISYKDSVARVVKEGDLYFRYISNEYKDEYNYLMNSGLYDELTKLGYLISHKEVHYDSADSNVYKKIEPLQIEFQSYPFEWSYNQWRNALWVYLRINIIALRYGMILKDGTPYNFYFRYGNPIMFDTTSFIFFKQNDPWIAYRQLCEEFFSPVTLMYYNGPQWSKITMSHISGLPLDFVSKQLPLKSWLKIDILLNIHLHANYLNKGNKNKESKGFTIEKIKSLHLLMLNAIQGRKKPFSFKNHWVNYYGENIESEKYLAHKEEIVRNWLKRLSPSVILDLGANTGNFSFIAAEYADKVIALESDIYCVDLINQRNLREKKNVYIALSQITEPNPMLGFQYGEINSIENRVNSHTVLNLGLSHHLYFTYKLSFKQLAEYSSTVCKNHLIIEFISSSDNKVKLITTPFSKSPVNYNIEEFIKSFDQYFTLEESIKVLDSHRTLLLFKKLS